MTGPDFATAVAVLLGPPRLEGTFRIHSGRVDVTDEFSEFRFKDPRLGGYLDRTRVESCLRSAPLTVRLRGSWAFNRGPADRGSADDRSTTAERNTWTVIVPPGALASITSPRRAFAVVRAAVGTLPTRVGRTVEVRAGADGLVVQLDWLAESSETNPARSLGVDLSDGMEDWHRADPEAVLRFVRERVSRSPGAQQGALAAREPDSLETRP